MANDEKDRVVEDRFHELLHFERELPSVSSVRPELAEVVAVYQENVRRIADTLRFSLSATKYARETTLVLAIACHNIGIVPTDILEAGDPNRDKIDNEYQRLASERRSESRDYFEDPILDTYGPRAHQQLIDDVLWSSDSGLQAVLASQVVATWTAYEVLATDLWVSSLNANPRLLATPVTASDQKKNDEPKQAPRSIPFWKLEQFGYDLRERMGDLLKSRFNFNSLDGIRAAYKSAFGEFIPDPRTLPPDERAKLEKADRALELLEALRSVFVHRGGVADKQFQDKVARLPLSGLSQVGRVLSVRVGADIELNCATTADMTRTVIDRCNEMIRTADRVLSME